MDLSESDAVYFSQVTHPGAAPHFEVKHISEGLLRYQDELPDFETGERKFREYVEQFWHWEEYGS